MGKQAFFNLESTNPANPWAHSAIANLQILWRLSPQIASL
jgi:hypothetical protein